MKNKNKSLFQLQQKTQRYKLLTLFAMIVALMQPELALAAGGLPDLTVGTIGVPGVDGNSSIMKTLIMTIGFVVFILVIAMLGFGMADTIASFFRQLNDSRKDGEWAPLIRFIGIAFVVLAIVFVIMGYINKYVLQAANGIT